MPTHIYKSTLWLQHVRFSNGEKNRELDQNQWLGQPYHQQPQTSTNPIETASPPTDTASSVNPPLTESSNAKSFDQTDKKVQPPCESYDGPPPAYSLVPPGFSDPSSANLPYHPPPDLQPTYSPVNNALGDASGASAPSISTPPTTHDQTSTARSLW